jgi:hypothetical protein
VIPFTLCTAGYRGWGTLQHLIRLGRAPKRIVSYRQKQDRTAAFESIAAIARDHSIDLEEGVSPSLPSDEWVIFVGWQYSSLDHGSKRIVIHDSLLPAYRGFAPTATALINGESEIGVTAISPIESIDAGPIYAQRRIPVTYPVKIKDMFDKQAALNGSLIVDLMDQVERGDATLVPQRHADATYSIWRDEHDYRIDWTRPSEEISRTIDALGYPFLGARTLLNGTIVLIDSAEVAEDTVFARRDVGKLWRIDERGPLVVCGTGCVVVTAMRTLDGTPIDHVPLRSRFV